MGDVLRKAVSDLTLDKLILQEAARGNFVTDTIIRFSRYRTWIISHSCSATTSAAIPDR